jgi:hypothetical protein
MAAAPETPPDSPLTMEDVLASPVFRDLMSPVYLALRTPDLAVGDPAFDFELPLLDGETHERTGETVRLSSFAGDRPVALVFGSYT